MSDLFEKAVEAALEELWRQDGASYGALTIGVQPGLGRIEVEGEIDLRAVIKAALIGGGYLVFTSAGRAAISRSLAQPDRETDPGEEKAP